MMQNSLDKIVQFLENNPLTLRTWLVSFGAIITIRYLVESVIFSFEHKNLDEFLGGMFHGTLLFFLLSYVVLLLLLKLLTGERIKKLANVLLWGQWMIVLPPIIDKLIFRDRTYWSFYVFDSAQGIIIRFIKFFGENPSFGITYGTRAMVAIATIGLGLYVYYKRQKIIWFFVSAALIYTALFLLGAFPSLVSFATLPFQGSDLLSIESQDIAKQFFTSMHLFGIENSGIKVVLHYKMALVYNILLFAALSGLLFSTRKKWFFALMKNVRYPQMIFNVGLFFMGVGLGWFYFPHNFNIDFFAALALIGAVLAIFSAWTFSVIVNDLSDIEIDAITNADRPLLRGAIEKNQYADLGLVLALLALLSSLVVSKIFFLIIAGYLLVTWIYSNHPFRLKRFVVVSSVFSSIASLLFLLGGYTLVSQGQTLALFPWKIIAFLFVSYALLIPLKDIKDIGGDRANKVTTLATLMGEENSRIILGAILFVSYITSVVVLNEYTLFLPALLFGSISYWIITNKKHNPRALPWWVLGIVIIYGILLVLIAFG